MNKNRKKKEEKKKEPTLHIIVITPTTELGQKVYRPSMWASNKICSKSEVTFFEEIPKSNLGNPTYFVEILQAKIRRGLTKGSIAIYLETTNDEDINRWVDEIDFATAYSCDCKVCNDKINTPFFPPLKTSNRFFHNKPGDRPLSILPTLN